MCAETMAAILAADYFFGHAAASKTACIWRVQTAVSEAFWGTVGALPQAVRVNLAWRDPERRESCLSCAAARAFRRSSGNKGFLPGFFLSGWDSNFGGILVIFLLKIIYISQIFNQKSFQTRNILGGGGFGVLGFWGFGFRV